MPSVINRANHYAELAVSSPAVAETAIRNVVTYDPSPNNGSRRRRFLINGELIPFDLSVVKGKTKLSLHTTHVRCIDPLN